MKKPSLKSGVILLVIVLGAIFLNKFVMKEWLIFYPKIFINLGNYLFIKAENFNDDDKLKQNRELTLGLQAKIDNLENENNFLRRATRISQKVEHPIVYAGIFNINLTPIGYNVLLNKGARDGISEGDIVITAEGVLVGKVQRVMQNFSRIFFVSDLEFKVTVKVMNSDTTGITRGALNDGIYLDFIVQEDKIEEKDVLMSTGNDMFPPALIVGSVDRVETNANQMFKKVHIRPAVRDTKLGRVLVIKME